MKRSTDHPATRTEARLLGALSRLAGLRGTVLRISCAFPLLLGVLCGVRALEAHWAAQSDETTIVALVDARETTSDEQESDDWEHGFSFEPVDGSRLSIQRFRAISALPPVFEDPDFLQLEEHKTGTLVAAILDELTRHQAPPSALSAGAGRLHPPIRSKRTVHAVRSGLAPRAPPHA